MHKYTQEQLDIALLKQKNDDIYKVLDRFDISLDRFDKSCERNFDRIDKTIDRIDGKLNWVITALIGSVFFPVLLHWLKLV